MEGSACDDSFQLARVKDQRVLSVASAKAKIAELTMAAADFLAMGIAATVRYPGDKADITLQWKAER